MDGHAQGGKRADSGSRKGVKEKPNVVDSVALANDNMAKRLRYKSVDEFVKINEARLKENGYKANELDEEKYIDMY